MATLRPSKGKTIVFEQDGREYVGSVETILRYDEKKVRGYMVNTEAKGLQFVSPSMILRYHKKDSK